MELREQLIDEVVESIKNDIENGDVTVLAELLDNLSNTTLIMSLPEEKWNKYLKIW